MITGCRGSRQDGTHLLLTGAAGLTGRAACRSWAPRFIVHAVSRGLPPHDIPSEVCWHQADLARDGLDEALPPRVDALVLLAQSRRFREFPTGALDVFEVNVGSVARLLDWGRRTGAAHVVSASSGSVYPPNSELREDAPLELNLLSNHYAASKLAAELIVTSFGEEFDGVCSLRPFFVFGPFQDPTMLVPRLIRSVQDQAAVTLAGPHGFRLTPTYVDDVVRAIEAAITLRGTHTVNVGGPQVLTLRELAQTIGDIIGKDPVFSEQPLPANDLVPNLERMYELLQPPSVDPRQGLREMMSDDPSTLLPPAPTTGGR